MSSISVYIRMRPFLQHQKEDQSVLRRIHFDDDKNQIGVELTEKRQKVFRFDRILDDQCTQAHLYNAIDMQALINRVVDGYHSTIFAYGQTGSGKTFTIEGEPGTDEGLIPRSILNLFDSIKHKQQTQPGLSFKVNLSFLQIYNEQIYDLIDANKKPLKMRWNKYQQFIVENLFEGQCRDETEALLWWKKGQKSKIIDSHNMNKESSRSHCILTMKVKCYELEDPSNCIQSKLEIVDLAGSERQKVTKSTGIVFREGIEINKSLFSLRQVIAALYECNTGSKSPNIPPYRDSKLTSLLKQSIGGNAYCAMIACINPTLTHFEESLQTLTYASMATYINNSPARNIDPKIQENQMLKQHNYNLKQQISKLSAHIEYLTALLQKNVCEKCGNSNSIKMESIDERLPQPRLQKMLTETDLIEGMKLPKFSTLPEAKNSSKNSIPNDTSILSDTQTRYFKKRTQPHEKSFTTQQTPKQVSYQLKSPKQILESITMIRDLINTNTKLREKIEMMREKNEKMEKQTFQIIQQNQLLRERWQMVGTNLKLENEVQTENEAPISLYERLLKQQKGQSLVYMPKPIQLTHTSTMNVKKSQKLVSLRSIHKETQPISESQNLRGYRPYNEIFKSSSKKKKESIMGRKRNLSNANRKDKSESFMY